MSHLTKYRQKRLNSRCLVHDLAELKRRTPKKLWNCLYMHLHGFVRASSNRGSVGRVMRVNGTSTTLRRKNDYLCDVSNRVVIEDVIDEVEQLLNEV